MKICIVNPGGRNWILHKISEKLVTELLKQGVEAISDDKPDFTADINHHAYLFFADMLLFGIRINANEPQNSVS